METRAGFQRPGFRNALDKLTVLLRRAGGTLAAGWCLSAATIELGSGSGVIRAVRPPAWLNKAHSLTFVSGHGFHQPQPVIDPLRLTAPDGHPTKYYCWQAQ
jgi:hypothetical protein